MIFIVYVMSFSLFLIWVMGIVQVLIGMIVIIVFFIGFILGGYIIQVISWYWLFLMNVIFGLIVVVGVWFYLDMDKLDFFLFKKIDFFGLFFLIGFLGFLEYILEEGLGDDWFVSYYIVGLMLISIISVVLFFWWVFFVDMLIVDLWVFCNCNFVVGLIFGFVVGVVLFGLVYLMLLFLGGVCYLNSLQIG